MNDHLLVAATEARCRILERIANPPPGGYTLTPCCHCCGRVYATWPTWLRLERVGVLDDDGTKYELRNCRCGSTIARETRV